jgi:hypothetical protein
VPQVVGAVKVLVIATGGISDARGIVAALALTCVYRKPKSARSGDEVRQGSGVN